MTAVASISERFCNFLKTLWRRQPFQFLSDPTASNQIALVTNLMNSGRRLSFPSSIGNHSSYFRPSSMAGPFHKETNMKCSSLFFVVSLLAMSLMFTSFLLTVHVSKLRRGPKYSYDAMLRDPFADRDALFDGFDNETGSPVPIVPNLVHFVLFGRNTLDFTTFLCMMAALKIHRPAQLMLHTDAENGSLHGHYWDQLLLTATKMTAKNNSEELGQSPKVTSVIRHRPTHVYGQPLSSVWHAADVARLDLLQQHGGISLDGDSLTLRPFSSFRNFEMALGWPKNGYIGTQVIVAHPRARMLYLWLEGYRRYKPRLWYYNAGQFPTQQILLNHPYLVHRVPILFGVHNLADRLYTSTKDNPDLSWWRKEGFYSVHLLTRHRGYLTHHIKNVSTTTDEKSVLNDMTSFGEMARWILYHVEPALPLPPWDKNG